MRIMKEEKAQVAFEYLLTAVFGIMLAITAAIIVETLRGIAIESRAEILNSREETISTILD